MYLPKRFENDDLKQSISIIEKYPLATVISATEAGPFVSHLPLVVEEQENQLILYGHLAHANPHWKLLDHRDVYVVFNGPNAYVTPTWYAENDVPTWNYAVVHAKGSVSLIEDRAGILGCLERLSQHAEKDQSRPWDFWIPPDLSDKGALEKAIVGFKISVSSVQSKFKLSQNRSAADVQGVIRGLESRQDDMSQEILALMLENQRGVK